MNDAQMQTIRDGAGFVAALDQSGGSTPGALDSYGIDAGAYDDDAEMFDLVHEMRTRIITDPAFDGARIIGTILFEDTMSRTIDGRPSARYLWDSKGIVPILKIDRGLADTEHGVQVMNPIPDLADLLAAASANEVFGTKMRSVIHDPNPAGMSAVVAQQFEIASHVIDADLCPIIELEVDIHSEHKAEAEAMLNAAILTHLERLHTERPVMLKLTLPDADDLYADLIAHPNVVRCFALSGGYSQREANDRLERNHGMVASFSRALLEGLSADQTDDEFTTTLEDSVDRIATASAT